jgi:hypothetical protein
MVYLAATTGDAAYPDATAIAEIVCVADTLTAPV